ncbi:VOC family protein [Streptosporangium sp. NPDC000095]|uniref:VOC family protein n=1 Tax=Streptosporangium sp. NPDC000095 TaxID=3366184 RepID=UPI00368B49EA
MVLDAPDAQALARFYARLLDWRITKDEVDWVTVAPADEGAYLAFQTSTDYVRPVWPSADGSQQMMMHLDLEVGDLHDAVAHALGEGATLAAHQPQDDVRVLLDPAGHPFCLYQVRRQCSGLQAGGEAGRPA